MRTLIDIPESELARLNELSRVRRVSRAHLVRCAIDAYLRTETRDALDAAFGMWGDRNIDGLEYTAKLRKEWDRES